MRPDVAQLQRELSDRIKNGPYYYYSFKDNGLVDDSTAIQLDKNFLIEFREPYPGD